MRRCAPGRTQPRTEDGAPGREVGAGAQRPAKHMSWVPCPGSRVPVLCPLSPPVSLPPASPVQTEDAGPWRGGSQPHTITRQQLHVRHSCSVFWSVKWEVTRRHRQLRNFRSKTRQRPGITPGTDKARLGCAEAPAPPPCAR